MIDIDIKDGHLFATFPEQVNLTNSQSIKKNLLSLVEKGFSQITIDFDKVEMIDSSGMGLLITVKGALPEEDSTIKIINVAGNIYKMMKIMRLYKHFEIEVKEEDLEESTS